MKPTPLLAKGFENVYDPAEDSFYLIDCLEADEEFLRSLPAAPLVAEIGSGSGVVSAFVPNVIAQRYTPLAGDVSLAACSATRETWARNWTGQIEAVQGDLLDWLRPHSVDVLLFNPPYVPSQTVPERPNAPSDDDKWLDLALDGGADGMEVTAKVLSKLDLYLSASGAAYVLFCASNHPDTVARDMEKGGWYAKLLGTRRAGWEILSVYRFTRSAGVNAL